MYCRLSRKFYAAGAERSWMKKITREKARRKKRGLCRKKSVAKKRRELRALQEKKEHFKQKRQRSHDFLHRKKEEGRRQSTEGLSPSLNARLSRFMIGKFFRRSRREKTRVLFRWFLLTRGRLRVTIITDRTGRQKTRAFLQKERAAGALPFAKRQRPRAVGRKEKNFRKMRFLRNDREEANGRTTKR